MPINIVPEWMTNLDDEDVSFIKKFLLASGSLKELANIYSVTYPTVRLRLDRLIQKIHISEQSSSEPYVALIKQLAVNEKIDFETAKLLISEYKKNKKDMIQYENSTFNDSDSIFSYDSDCDNDRTADLPFQNETSLASLILPVVSAIYATFNAFLILVNGLANNLTRVFLFTIILYLPTAVFFIIYMKAHKSNVPNQEISRMTIQDLD